MNSEKVTEFFNRLAATWDADMIRNDAVIERILDLAGARPGISVLDVATGTGVLIPDYLGRDVRHVTGIDISPEMIRIATGKFGAEPRVSFVTGDALLYETDERFDLILIYNAFPHFPEPAALLLHLASLLAPGGRLAVAHGMSRDKINAHHSGTASEVSLGLPAAEDLAKLFPSVIDIDAVYSTPDFYFVGGALKTAD